MDEQKINQEKYGGGDTRIQQNNQQFKRLTAEYQLDFVDTYSILKKGFSGKSNDGVHLNEKAQFEMASEIVNMLNKKSKL
jgi:lysophospholipase L1-like esterase